MILRLCLVVGVDDFVWAAGVSCALIDSRGGCRLFIWSCLFLEDVLTVLTVLKAEETLLEVVGRLIAEAGLSIFPDFNCC